MVQTYNIRRASTKPERSAAVQEVNNIVSSLVRDHLSSGSTKLAVGAAADILLMLPRTARGHYHNEIAYVSAETLEDVRTAYAGYLRQRVAELQRERQQISAWLATHDARLTGEVA